MALTRALTTGGGDEDGWGADGFVTTMKDLLSKEQRFFIKLSSIDHKKREAAQSGGDRRHEVSRP